MALNHLSKLRQSIEKLSKWEKSQKAFGYIKTETEAKPQYIYEFFCAMSILEDLSKNYLIKLQPGKKGYVFPKSPGNKKEWARFLIKEKEGVQNTLFEVCLGIKIKISSSPKTTVAADISIHYPEPTEDPDDTHVILIMDAKYKEQNTESLDIGAIREFAQCARDMNTPKSSAIDKLKFHKLTKMNGNCLITNGQVLREHEQYCINNKIKQVGKFDCDHLPIEVIG